MVTLLTLVAWLIRVGGPAMESRLRHHVELLGWIAVGLVVIAVIFLHD